MSEELQQLIQLLYEMNYEELLLFILKMNALNGQTEEDPELRLLGNP